jgi:hypothetical protein
MSIIRGSYPAENSNVLLLHGRWLMTQCFYLPMSRRVILIPHPVVWIFELLLETANEHGSAALVATHNPELASLMDRQITLTDGIIHA